MQRHFTNTDYTIPLIGLASYCSDGKGKGNSPPKEVTEYLHHLDLQRLRCLFCDHQEEPHTRHQQPPHPGGQRCKVAEKERNYTHSRHLASLSDPPLAVPIVLGLADRPLAGCYLNDEAYRLDHIADRNVKMGLSSDG